MSGCVSFSFAPRPGSVRRSDGDAIGGVGEGEVVYRIIADSLAQLADDHASRLIPGLPNGTEIVIAPEAIAVGSDVPGVVGEAHASRSESWSD